MGEELPPPSAVDPSSGTFRRLDASDDGDHGITAAMLQKLQGREKLRATKKALQRATNMLLKEHVGAASSVLSERGGHSAARATTAESETKSGAVNPNTLTSSGEAAATGLPTARSVDSTRNHAVVPAAATGAQQRDPGERGVESVAGRRRADERC